MSTQKSGESSRDSVGGRRPYAPPVLTAESRIGPDTSKNNTHNFDNHTGNTGISGPS